MMSIIDGLLPVFAVLSILSFGVSIVMLPFRKLRPKGKKLLGGSIVVFVLSLVGGVYVHEKRAQDAGYQSGSDMAAAEKAGVTDPTIWKARREAEKAQRQIENARERDRLLKLATDRQEARDKLLAKPADETAFIHAVTQSRAAFHAAETDFQKGATRPARAAAVCQALKSAALHKWVGKVVILSTNSEGKGVFGIDVEKNVVLSTWNNSLSDYGSNTLIEPNSKVYQQMATLKEGQMVRVEAAVAQGDVDCVNEQSITLSGSMLEPVFTATFLDIRKIDLSE